MTSDFFKFEGKVPVEIERLTMLVIVGTMIFETCLRRTVWMGSRSHCLLGESCRSLCISSMVAGLKDGNDAGIYGGSE